MERCDWLFLGNSLVAVCTVLSYPSIGLGQEVEGRLVLAGEECQGVRRSLVECGSGDTVKAQAGTAEPTKASVQRYTEQCSPDPVDKVDNV